MFREKRVRSLLPDYLVDFSNDGDFAYRKVVSTKNHSIYQTMPPKEKALGKKPISISPPPKRKTAAVKGKPRTGGGQSVEVYGKTWCGWSKRAAKIANVTLKDYDKLKNQSKKLAQVLAKKHTTMPAVFVDGEFIGGCRELEQLIALKK